MWYHANFIFDYQGFENALPSLVSLADKGNYEPLRRKALEIVQTARYSSNAYAFDFDKAEKSIDGFGSDDPDCRNSLIGSWFFIVLSTFLELSPVTLGYDWRILNEKLQDFGWHAESIGDLLNGKPVGLLLGKETNLKEVVHHNDPYWDWVRPRNSYNQGGWLSLAKCVNYRSQLLSTLEDLNNKIERDEKQLEVNPWMLPFGRGIKNTIALLEFAEEKNRGVYSAVFWDW